VVFVGKAVPLGAYEAGCLDDHATPRWHPALVR
jgi:hypothetical protein